MTAVVFADEADGTAAKKSKKKVHLLMVDNRKDNKRVVRQFKKVGVKVTTYYGTKKVKPSKYDGLVIPGGNNMDPRSYHTKRSPYTYGTDRKKDKIQINAIKRFVKAGKPVLGICRGNQVINVAFGGTLKQHIPGWHKGYRKVRTVKDSWVRTIFGNKYKAYHSHHQYVGKLGKGLKATAYDVKDGRIEGIQHKELPVYGVQWHPDLRTNKTSYKFYRSFKQICIDYRK